MLPGDPVLHAIRTGGAWDGDGLDRLVETRERAGRWSGDGRLLTDLALAQMLQADPPASPDAGNARLWERAEANLRAGLARSPASPHAWARLAQVQLVNGRPADEVVKALRMSLMTGRNERELALPRLAVGNQVRHAWDAEMTDEMLDQIRLAWHTHPQGLTRSAIRHGYADLARGVLVEDLKALARFEAYASRL
ncbi:hypothetical protein [Arenibaculum sp.]|uniref:hypothetical protein n=1 Tax=Arenibaculum sp. TaxID=2865862 RepID=UPI002E13171C|nr:hypothetical protein [Arenibaculum sp.]